MAVAGASVERAVGKAAELGNGVGGGLLPPQDTRRLATPTNPAVSSTGHTEGIGRLRSDRIPA